MKLYKPVSHKNLVRYRNGGQGFKEWCEEHVCLPVYPEGSAIPIWTQISKLPTERNPVTNRNYAEMWESFCEEVAFTALEMKDGRFIYRLIVFCWMRGEGKSLDACLIQLWKFFCFPRQQIMLGANSKDQVKFVHYDIMRDIILNSPKLLWMIGGKRNVKEKEIALLDPSGNKSSLIRSISSFSGIVSNITGYTFSEIFDMKNPKFFVQLDGSIRNIPNALGVIDSTVSETSHILYQLYQTYQKGEDEFLYFSYRSSPKASYKDFWNPQMTQAQLNSYASKFPKAEFDRYFKNTWNAGTEKLFTPAMVDATRYIGHQGQLGMSDKVLHCCEQSIEFIETSQFDKYRNDEDKRYIWEKKSEEVLTDLIPIEKLYTLTSGHNHNRMADLADLENIGNAYNTDFAIIAGIDRSDPMKAKSTKARTIMSLIAKGLVGSRTNPSAYFEEGPIQKYIYFLLGLIHIEDATIESIKYYLKEAIGEYDGIDTLCSERWGMWDISGWCEEQDIIFEPTFPTYDKQREAFSELFILIKNGRFKAPRVPIIGSKTDDLFKEEFETFDHNPFKRWYGSPQKMEKYGIQDDTVFSIGWGVYGGRNLGVVDFRKRERQVSFGEFVPVKTVGEY